MQVGNLKTGVLYFLDEVPERYRYFHRIGCVEVLRGSYGEKVGLVDISHDESGTYWDFAEIGQEDCIY